MDSVDLVGKEDFSTTCPLCVPYVVPGVIKYGLFVLTNTEQNSSNYPVIRRNYS